MNKLKLSLLENLLSLRAKTREEAWRGQLLSLLMLIAMFGGITFAVLAALGFLTPSFAPLLMSTQGLFGVLIGAGIVAGLWFANRRGYARWTAYLFLLMVVIYYSLYTPPDQIGRFLVPYTVPIIMASFIIHPTQSFVFALASTLAYTAIYFFSKDAQASGYNLVSVFGFFTLATISWLIASRLEKIYAESLQAESDLRHQAATFENMFDAVILTDREGGIIDWNPAAERMFGYSREEVLGKAPSIIHIPENIPTLQGQILADVTERGRWAGEVQFIRKDGARGVCEAAVVPIKNNQGIVIATVGVNRDITQRKHAENALRDREELFRKITDNVQDGIAVVEEGKITYLNDRICEITGYSREEFVKQSGFSLATPEEKPRLDDVYAQAASSGHLPAELVYWINRKDGSRRCIRNRYSSKVIDGKSVTRYIFTTDVTEQKLYEQELESVAQISTSLRAAQSRASMIPIIVERSSTLLHGGSAMLALKKLGSGEIFIHQATGGWAQAGGKILPGGTGPFEQVITTGSPLMCEDIREHANTTWGDLLERDFAAAIVPLVTQEKNIGALAIGRAIPFTGEEIKALTALAEIAAGALHRAELYEQTLRQTQQMRIVAALNRSLSETLSLPEIYDQLDQGIYHLFDSISAVLISSLEAPGQIITCLYASIEGRPIDATELPPIPLSPLGRGPQSETIHTQAPLIVNDMQARMQTASVNIDVGSKPEPRSALYAPMMTKGQVTGVLQVQSYLPNHFCPSDAEMLALVAHAAAITIENAKLFSETARRLERLTALRTIDMAINASMDLRVTLNILLEQIVNQLHADAAAILMYNPDSHSLRYTAHHAFRTGIQTQDTFYLGQGLAGRAALERKTLHIPNLAQVEDERVPAQWLIGESFVACWAAPLVAKGQLKGVLEVFLRSPFEPDLEWIDFLDTLAGQAAIAVDNATMFNDLQRSNMELMLAYDTTLEGWSHALDLRDRDTEGHTQRVTELSMRLAQAMNLGEKELLQMRRGALLHDIGKLGVPDRILHKPGPLSPDEQEIMHCHPVYAYDMLSSIEFLAPAIDIPYCHHEKWDGSGYPRGLKGEQIPLPARIFAIADVWDSIRSDRPYRPAWSVEKSLAHMHEESGKYFDPHIIEIFLKSEVWK